MANTQGMPDEFVESLMMTTAPRETTTANSSTTTTKSKNDPKSSSSSAAAAAAASRVFPGSATNTTAGDRQRKRLQERMEMPLPQGGPAARILRPSPQSSSQQQSQEPHPSDGGGDDNAEMRAEPASSSNPEAERLFSPILGNILERAPSATNSTLRKSSNRRGNGNSNSNKAPSRFAAGQQQLQQKSLNGFPSVNVPLGTFCQPKKSKAPVERQNDGGPRPVVVAAAAAAATKTSSKKATEGITTESMLEASRRDAEGMLQGMTPDEIKQQQHELTAALSPDLVAFLRQRGAGNKSQTSNTTTSNSLDPTQVVDPNALSEVTSRDRPKRNNNRNTKKEKERLAEIMSQVKTHQDLDQAYHAIMNEAHPLEASGESSKNDEDTTTIHSGEDKKKGDDFALACDLLRSTNPRQTLWAARVVQQKLSQYIQSSQSQRKGEGAAPSPSPAATVVARDWPLVLPVSLRCLLDQPIQANTGYILHTYILQSLYSLLLLTAHPDHIVRVLPGDTPTPAMIYAECFLDDAIPTPRLETAYSATPIKPLTTTAENEETKKNDNTNNSYPAAAYATQSSSTSAQADGEAFDRDPMWTLLSKMKMVPRLAQLAAATTMSNFDWPPEAWTALIGILCMIAQRSPGAASAIAHHDTILPRLVARILPCLQTEDSHEDNSDFIIAYATFQLFATLARQSRVAAQSLPLVDLLPPLLARTPNTDLEFRVQQLGLQLWRTVLRYGLGMEALETITTAAARHWALPYTHRYSLSTEFVSALAQVLECAILAQAKGDAILEKERAATTTTGGTTKTKPSVASVLSTLSMASKYLAATQQTVLLQPTTTIDATMTETADECLRFRWNAARLRFLTQYWNLAEITTDDRASSSPTTEEINTEEWSMEQVLTCLEAMDEWTDTGGLVQVAWSRLAKYASCTECGQAAKLDDDSDAIKCEAAASAFLDTFVQCLLSLATSLRTNGNRMIQELARSVSKHFLERILEGLRLASQQPVELSSSVSSSPVVALAQRGWISQCHFAVSKVFSHCHAIGQQQSSADIHLIRMMVFHLLGRLERGSESMAAVLFSQDVLFRVHGNPLESEDLSSTLPWGVASQTSPISSMFLGELCGSEQARKQLDHSFKLQHGFGVTKNGLGAFALDSLLSNADQPKPSTTTDLALPIGELWLWQCLSGQIRTKEEGTVAQGFYEATNVVAAVLGLMMELEEGEELMDCATSIGAVAGYSARIPLGAKLYYLMNVCLHTEAILREDPVLELAEAVLERYWPRLNRTSSILEFAQACQQHTEPTRKANSEDEVLEDKDKKLFELFNPEIPNEVALSSAEMRSLEAFLDDMAEAYNDYGAQYDVFTKCMRLFLLPVFPSAIRCRTLRELRGVLHLLTLPSEMEHQEELRTLLCHSVSGGTDEITSVRDAPEFLDAVTVIMVPNSGPRPLTGYMLAYGMIIMARNLVMALQSEGLDAMKHRLGKLDARTVDLIFQSVSHMVGTTGTKNDLVDATLQSLLAAEQSTLVETALLSPQIADERLRFLQDKLGNQHPQ